MSIEEGLPTEDLKTLTNSDILIKTRKLQCILSSIEKIVTSYREADSLLYKLKCVRQNFNSHDKLLISQLSMIENNTIFDSEKIVKIEKESNLSTKAYLIENYKKIEVKYSNSVDYYNMIDKTYYSELLDNIKETMF